MIKNNMPPKITDVTNLVSFGEVDAGSLPITKCLCGQKWDYWSGPVLSEDFERLVDCEKCGRKYYFRNEIKVFCVE